MTHATLFRERRWSRAVCRTALALALTLACTLPAAAQYAQPTPLPQNTPYGGGMTTQPRGTPQGWSTLGTIAGQTPMVKGGTPTGTPATGAAGSSSVRMSGSNKNAGKGGPSLNVTPGPGNAKAAAGGGSAAPASAKTTAAFSTTAGSGLALTEAVVLQFTPLDIFVQPGGLFDITVRLDNNTTRDVDGLDFAIGFDPQRISYVGLAPEASDNKAALELANRFNIEPGKGRLDFSAAKLGTLSRGKTDVVPLRFRARDLAGRVPLHFLSSRKETPAAWSKGENVLGGQGCTGVLDAAIVITDDPGLFGKATPSASTLDLTTAMPEAMPQEDPAVKQWIVGKQAVRADAPVALRLQGPAHRIVRTGEDFWVDVVLENETLASIDSLAFRMRFDPKVLEVVDEDKDNWIQLNVNAWDGAFHEAYPFDLHYANRADNARGVLEYRAGRRESAYAFPSGIFARVHFHALQACDATVIALTRRKNSPDSETWVKGMGMDRLTTTWNDAKPPAVLLRVTAAGKPATVPALPSE